MNTCKTCKHWEPIRHGRPDYLFCCGNPKVIESEDLDGANIQHADSCLFTGPNFGCIHHEAKL